MSYCIQKTKDAIIFKILIQIKIICYYQSRIEESRNAFKILTVTPSGKRPLGRPRRRWENNVRMDLKVIGINTRNWVDSGQDRDYWRALVNVALNLWVQ